MKAEITGFVFDDEEQAAIAEAMSAAKPWYHPVVKGIRKRIKEFHLNMTADTCCYCQRDLNGEFTLVIDVEHVLPSSLYKPQTFQMWNLSASCKRCNMDIKKNDVSFLQGNGSLEDSARYKLAHPNFDDVEDHLLRLVQQVGRTRIVKYVKRTRDKGNYTYEYFRLTELETSSYDEAQGANRTNIDHMGNYESMRSRVDALLVSIDEG